MLHNEENRTGGAFCQCEVIKEVIMDDDEFKVMIG